MYCPIQKKYLLFTDLFWMIKHLNEINHCVGSIFAMPTKNFNNNDINNKLMMKTKQKTYLSANVGIDWMERLINVKFRVFYEVIIHSTIYFIPRSSSPKFVS